jgi:hypothetical protein
VIRYLVLAALLTVAAGASAEPFAFEQKLDLKVGDRVWLSTMTTPLDGARRDATYKVYTHIYDFEGKAPLTKGPGGKYTHHRGMFIGWKDTLVNGRDYDTWHMPDNAQQHIGWKALEAAEDHARQVEEVHWTDETGKPFISEIRTITAREAGPGLRVFDFQSDLTSLAGTIPLKGDLQHAGMQVRLANEVSEHEESTRYILPEGARELEDDKVVGAWWVCCSAEIGGKRYWLIHMTPPDHPTGQPVYSIRRYARFGAFFEPELQEGQPLSLRFRIVLSGRELNAEECAKLYGEFAQGR